ncbi:MAG: homoserine kinase [Gammaproteobacteria bacterium]
MLSATASAPACVGNVAVGFDFLGHTIIGPCDRATVRRITDPVVRISSIRGVTRDIPLTAEHNTAGAALISLRQALGLHFGFELELDKGIPLASGMGGSAASCVAALVAANALLVTPIALETLYQCALDGESLASGARNGDNVGPMLYGGLVIAGPKHVVSVPVPPGLHCVLVHPDVQLKTLQARRVLSTPYILVDIVQQTHNLALVLSGCFSSDLGLIRAGLSDHLIEPRRAALIPGFPNVKQTALDCQALGAGISGAGPSVFAWFADESVARQAAEKMQLAFAHRGITSDAWVSPVAGPSARLIGHAQ